MPIGFADMGQHGVKNIARPVRVYRVEKRDEPRTDPADDAAAAPLALPDRPSIAVLPFGLSRIKWLFVIARNSSFAYKGKPPTSARSAASSACVTCSKAAFAGRRAACASPAS